MRLFIAIDLNNEDYFKEIQKQIDSENAKISLTNSYHLTLKFLGKINETIILKIKEKLNNIKFDSFTINTTKIGVFPSQNFIKVVWLGLDPEDKIAELQKNIDDSLKKLFNKEKQFKPHITLARVKYTKDKSKFIEKLKNIKPKEKEFNVKNIKLIKSKLTPNGPVYEDLFSFN